LFEEIRGRRAGFRDTYGSKQAPPDVAFEQPGKKSGKGSFITSRFRDRYGSLKQVRVGHAHDLLSVKTPTPDSTTLPSLPPFVIKIWLPLLRQALLLRCRS